MMVRRRCAMVNKILWPNSSRIVVWILSSIVNIEHNLLKGRITYLASVSKSTYESRRCKHQTPIVDRPKKPTDAVDSSMIITVDLRRRLFAAKLAEPIRAIIRVALTLAPSKGVVVDLD